MTEAREWFCGGPILPRDNATELADNLERLARELRLSGDTPNEAV